MLAFRWGLLGGKRRGVDLHHVTVQRGVSLSHQRSQPFQEFFVREVAL